MLKRAIILGVFALVAIFAFLPGRSYASQIQDTGGGDATQVGSTTEAVSSGNSAEGVSQQIDNIINKDYVPNVKAEDFFAKVNGKLAETMTFGQKMAAIILGIIFVIDLVILAISAIGPRKERVAPCAVALLIIALAFVADVYVMDILGAFTNWLGN